MNTLEIGESGTRAAGLVRDEGSSWRHPSEIEGKFMAQRRKVQEAHRAFHECFPELHHRPEEEFDIAAQIGIIAAEVHRLRRIEKSAKAINSFLYLEEGVKAGWLINFGDRDCAERLWGLLQSLKVSLEVDAGAKSIVPVP